MKRLPKAALLAALTLLAGRAAAAVAPGLFLDAEAEKRLEASLGRLSALAGAEKPEYGALAGEIAAARRNAESLADLASERSGNRATTQADKIEMPAQSPVVLFGNATLDQVQTLWREQLQVNVKAARDLLAGDPATIAEWVPSSGRHHPRARAMPIAQALREAGKAAGLLARPAAPVTFKRGERLFADDFAKGAGNWEMFGQCATSSEGGAFRLKDEKPAHPDSMMWTKKEFDGEFLAEFTFTPHTVGTSAGALFTICGRPRQNHKLSECVGEDMNTYNYGIDGYHFSMHRGTTGLGNVRRVGPGLKMLASGKDPCPTPDQAYRIAIGKVGPTIFLFVDGKLFHSYCDAATYGPVLEAGRIGLRHWAGMDGSYKDFRVVRLVAETPASQHESGWGAPTRLVEPIIDLMSADPPGGAAKTQAAELNPALLAMPDNTWAKQTPNRNPEGRSYSGVCYGDGRIFYFGGGHASYRCNDVEIYDVAANTWTQFTEPEDWRDVDKWTHLTDEEKKKVKGIGGGWGVPYLSPKGRPLTQHTFQMHCWFPEAKAFYCLFQANGLWAFDCEKREWRLAVKEHPRGGDIHNWNLAYDPELKTVISIFGDRDRGIWAFDRESKTLKKKFDAYLGPAHIYSTYDAAHKAHVVVAAGKWFALDTATGKARPLKKLPIDGSGGVTPSLEYDPPSKLTLVVTYDVNEKKNRTGPLRTFAYDLDKDEWTEFKLAGVAPTGTPDFDYLVYDPVHNCHLYVNVLGVQGSPRQGGKVDGVFAFRFKPAATTRRESQ